MFNRTISPYRGVAIFGPPGSGKTTIARALKKLMRRAVLIEAAERVIYPALSIKKPFPRRESDFARLAATWPPAYRGRSARQEARALYEYLENRYSSTFVAKALIQLHTTKFPRKFLIISGARGLENARMLKQQSYAVVFLTASDRVLRERLSNREGESERRADAEERAEERMFLTNAVKKVANFSFDTGVTGPQTIARAVKSFLTIRECVRCINTTMNPVVVVGPSGLCSVCEQYVKNFRRAMLRKELKFLLSLRGSGAGAYDAMVGISGGKDSTAALYEAKRLGFTPLAFSFDTGYYPKHITVRARRAIQPQVMVYCKYGVPSCGWRRHSHMTFVSELVHRRPHLGAIRSRRG